MRVTLRLASAPALTCDGRVAWVDRDVQAGYESAGVAFKVKVNGDLDPFVGPCGGGGVATTGEYEKGV